MKRDIIVQYILKLIEETPVTTFVQAFNEIGLDNMTNMYDLARMKKIFVEEYLQKGDKASYYVIHSERPYFWSNEYVGIAPDDHPAKGKIIMAKVSGIEPEKRPHESINVIFGHVGQISVSSETYVVCPEWKLDDILYVSSFEKGAHSIMRPLPDRSQEAAWKSCVTKYGSLYVKELRGLDFFPITMRPASWHGDLVFTNTDSMDCAMKAIQRDKLQELLTAYDYYSELEKSNSDNNQNEIITEKKSWWKFF